MAIRAVLFDKDGVLVDFDATFGPATNKVLDRLCRGDAGKKLAVAEILHFDVETSMFRETSFLIAGTSLDMAHHVGEIFGRVDGLQFAAEIDRHYGEFCVEVVEPVSGVAQALGSLRKSGYPLGIATNDAEANARSQMQKLGLVDHFHKIMGADSGHGPKPEPGMIHAFLEFTGLARDEIIMVGDSVHDMQAGRAAGVMTIGVLSGPAQRDELEPHAHAVLPSVASLPSWLQEHNFGSM